MQFRLPCYRISYSTHETDPYPRITGLKLCFFRLIVAESVGFVGGAGEVVNAESTTVLERIAKSTAHGSAELWLLLYIIGKGGKAKWVDVVKAYAQLRGWEVEASRVKLERAYLKLKRLGLLQKRREKVLLNKPREVYVSLTPRARALLLSICS